ncbi:sulfotransferase 1 family member D1-like [Tubulanus polymorphus]|uniref:sulfotransferase 1 family member D1-like n=1 Tax=Tubulanus polymorphus TaxID=672921 RepID=UPI003DA6365D
MEQLPTKTLANDLYPRPIEYVNDVPINLEYHSKERINEIMNVEFRSDDIIVATYPKAGTTMTQEITWLVMNNGDVEAAKQEYIAARIPFLEFTPPVSSKISGQDDCTSMNLFLEQNSPRLCKVHLPWNLGPSRAVDEFNAKLIYVMRNPKDTAVSNFYFAQSFELNPYRGSFSDFLKVYLAPDMDYGPIFDHYLGYWNERHRENILILYYEDLVHDHRAQVVKIAKFLQKDLTDEVVDRIVASTRFKSMKENPMTNYAYDGPVRPNATPFMRKGEAGDWKNHFTAEEAELYDRLIAEKLTSVGIKY